MSQRETYLLPNLTVDERGRITIPIEYRERFGIGDGDVVDMELVKPDND